ncbi:hypothetical protein ABEB36_002752 [Hypothenemus hampei]|uniref:Uncharacterized protein n=1 Tax=Hypothenemus hampei TaxID=57062 RepID=A0ABD1F7H8_HYPHA
MESEMGKTLSFKKLLKISQFKFTAPRLTLEYIKMAAQQVPLFSRVGTFTLAVYYFYVYGDYVEEHIKDIPSHCQFIPKPTR